MHLIKLPLQMLHLPLDRGLAVHLPVLVLLRADRLVGDPSDLEEIVQCLFYKLCSS